MVDPRAERAGVSADASKGLQGKIEALRNLGALATIYVVVYHSRVTDLRLTRDQAAGQVPPWLYDIDVLLHWPGVALHVPIFFVVSGFMFFRVGLPTVAQFRRKLLDRFESLVVPFLLWNALVLAAVLLLQSAHLGGLMSRTRPVDGPVDALWRLTGDPIHYQFWFVRELILLCLLTPLIGLIVRSRLALAWLALGFAGFALTKVIGTVLSLRGIFFFSLGAYLAMRELPLRLPISRAWLRGAWVAYGASVVASAFLPVSRTALLWIVAVQVVVGLALAATAYDASSRLWNDRLVSAVRTHAFFVYAFHEPLLSVIRKGLMVAMGSSGPVLAAVLLLVPTITLAVCVVVARWISRNSPRVYGVLTGGRWRTVNRPL